MILIRWLNFYVNALWRFYRKKQMSQTSWPVSKTSWKIVVSFLKNKQINYKNSKNSWLQLKKRQVSKKKGLKLPRSRFRNYWLTTKLLPRSKRNRKLPIKLNKVNSLTVWTVLKTSRLELKVWKTSWEIIVTFMQVSRVFSKKKLALVELLVLLVSIWPLMCIIKLPWRLRLEPAVSISS